MEKSKRTRIDRSEKQIRNILRRYERSGKGKREFCDLEGISYASFGNWFRKKSQQGRGSQKKKDSFVELSPAAPATGLPVVRLNFSGGRSLDFYSVPDAELLKFLLQG